MELGIFAKVFARASAVESFRAAADAGFSCVHFDFSMTAGEILPASLGRDAVRAVRKDADGAGVRISSVEGTYNMAHSDAGTRLRGAAALDQLIAHATGLGTCLVGICTGTRADHMWRYHPDNATPEAWRDMCDSVSTALRTAEDHGVVLCVECEHGNVISSAPLARRLLDEMASPALAITLDAANLIPPGAIDRQREVLAEAFELLGDNIALAHAKDRDGTFVAAGAGELDYTLFMGLLAEARFEGPLILHSLSEDAVPASLSHVMASIAAARARRGHPDNRSQDS